MRGDPAADRDGAHTRPVGVEPWPRCLLHVLPVLAPWLLVRAGRPICLVAQRVPALVRLVRAIRSRACSGTGSSRDVRRRAV